MAELLEKFEHQRTRQGKSKYPWQEWLDGNPWKLEAGVDYNCMAQSLVSSASKFAQRNGFGVRSSISEDGLTLTLQAVERRERRKSRR